MSVISASPAGLNPQPRTPWEQTRNWQRLCTYLVAVGGGLTMDTDGSLKVAASIHFTTPTFLIATGTPGGLGNLTSITGSTLTLTVATQNQNTFLAGFATASGQTPTFRLIVPADLASGATNTYLLVINSGGAMTWAPAGTSSGIGTVSSVALDAPAIFTVSGSPVTTAGTLTLTLANEAANTVFAGPTTGVPAPPAFRSLLAVDLATSPGTGNVLTISGGVMGWAAPSSGNDFWAY